MPSVDIVSEIDMQEADNAINAAKKEIENRYDFRGTKTELELNKKDGKINLEVPDEMKLKAVKEILVGRFVARKLSPKVLEFGTPEPASQGALRVEVKLKQGLDSDDARHIVKFVKETKLKVQASIQGDQVRLSGNKIDDLQTIMQALRADEEISVPVQFTNMKR